MPNKIQEFFFTKRKAIIRILVAGFLAVVGTVFGVNVDKLQGAFEEQIEAAVVEGRLNMVLCFSDADCLIEDVQGVCVQGACKPKSSDEALAWEAAKNAAIDERDAGIDRNDAGP